LTISLLRAVAVVVEVHMAMAAVVVQEDYAQP
jgi:hypothetical protein